MTRFTALASQAQNSLRVDVNYMMEDFLGAEGITSQEIDGLGPEVEAGIQALKSRRGEMTWRDLPYTQAGTVEEIRKFAGAARKRFANFVVLGIGGSALGPMAVHQALNHPQYNELTRDKRGGPRFYVLDNVDPERFAALLDVIKPEETLFNVITKSGSTSETMAQFMIIRSVLRRVLGERYKEHLVATTDREKGNLVNISRAEGYHLFFVPVGVGGRFSELSPVGLLPAAMGGIDIGGLLAGAAYMDKWIGESESITDNPAYLRAVLHYLAMKRGKNISVMMPYAEGLKLFADWYAQLWAESLGKRFNFKQEEVFAGQTPVKALGVTDQHSQVQLYTEGPFDKVINFLAVDRFRQEVVIPRDLTEIPSVAFLGGHTLNELMEAERQATEYALYKALRMNTTVFLPEINEFSIGQLIYMLEVETAFIGELLGINAFDQPGVEEGKNATYALMGRPGFENKREELAGAPGKMERFLLCRKQA